MFKQLGLIVLYVIAFIVACVLAPLIIVSMCVMIALILALAFICWMCGLPLSITQNKRNIGYVRWFKFYRE